MKMQELRARVNRLHRAAAILERDSYLKGASFTSDIREEIKKWEGDLKQIETFKHELSKKKL